MENRDSKPVTEKKVESIFDIISGYISIKVRIRPTRTKYKCVKFFIKNM